MISVEGISNLGLAVCFRRHAYHVTKPCNEMTAGGKTKEGGDLGTGCIAVFQHITGTVTFLFQEKPAYGKAGFFFE